MGRQLLFALLGLMVVFVASVPAPDTMPPAMDATKDEAMMAQSMMKEPATMMTNMENPMAKEPSMMTMQPEMSQMPKDDVAVVQPVAEAPKVDMQESPLIEPTPDDQEATGRADAGPDTVADAVKRIYSECVQQGSFSCVKPKVMSYLRSALKKDAIFLTRDLAIEKTGEDYFPPRHDYLQQNEAAGDASAAVERVERFLGSHALRVRMPQELRSSELADYVPAFLLKGLPTEISVPLADPAVAQSEARGFMKKVVVPFMLGLKFKAAALLPLAMALIALKTWKAMTLGLLSLVLTGAMLIFRLSKPKVVSYEVVHYPHATVEHHAAPAPSPYDHHGYGRALREGHDLPYRAHAPSAR